MVYDVSDIILKATIRLTDSKNAQIAAGSKKFT